LLRRVLVAVYLVSFCGGIVLAQQEGELSLSRWFSESQSAPAYRLIEQDLYAIFRAADASSIPPSLLINRLNLAAARKLPPATVVAGMRQELARLRSGSEILDRVAASAGGMLQVTASRRTELLNTVSIYLGGGLSVDFLDSILSGAATSGRPIDDAFQACSVVLEVKRVGGFTDAELLTFGSALVKSRISPSGYGTIGSFIVRSSAADRERAGLLASVSRILRRGGGLPQMELELGRRR